MSRVSLRRETDGPAHPAPGSVPEDRHGDVQRREREQPEEHAVAEGEPLAVRPAPRADHQRDHELDADLRVVHGLVAGLEHPDEEEAGSRPGCRMPCSTALFTTRGSLRSWTNRPPNRLAMPIRWRKSSRSRSEVHAPTLGSLRRRGRVLRGGCVPEQRRQVAQHERRPGQVGQHRRLEPVRRPAAGAPTAPPIAPAASTSAGLRVGTVASM